ncbi:AAA family ATPase [Leptolyngbya sp. PL-A3]
MAAFDRATGREKGKKEQGEESTASSHCEMMLISGYSGVGKSALVQELYKSITAKRGYFVSGKFDQFQRNIPYSAIAHALQKLVQQLLSEPEEQVQQWRSRLLTALGSNGQLIVDVIPEVELIIGKQLPVPEVGAAEAQNRFNRVFQQFIRVFCSKEHPLVIFLDDLQWVDSATLKLIELIMLDDQTQHLFLIGAYRDNEVDSTHPLALMLDQLRKQEIVFQEVVLKPLTLEPLSQLLAETLRQNLGTIRPLGELALRKTEGNPFFVGEFLRMLYGEKLLSFDAKGLCWQWDMAQIQTQNITDNVVELLLNQLKKLPENTQHVLQLAACVGAEFDLETVAIADEKSLELVSLDLLAAIQAGLIQPLSELDENLFVQDYKFLHDRVQQAAYALIDEPQKQVVHLQIGRNLLKKIPLKQRAERLFEIVDHLNSGIELVTDQLERNEIAKLNLQAGQKALTANAYQAAFKYFNVGLKLLNMESWQREYDLTLSLHSEAAEAAYLSGHFDEMERLVKDVLNHAKTVLDQVKVYNSRIQACLSQGDPREALEIGLEVLQLLRVSLVQAPTQLDVQTGLAETASRLAGQEIEGLIELPEMSGPEPLAAIHILASIVASAFMVSPALLILIVCRMVNLSLSYGNAPWSPLGYAAYGFVLCEVTQDIERGYQFGKLALRLLEKLNINECDAKVFEVLGTHVIHWKEHLGESLSFLRNGYQRGVEIGDFEFAGYSAFHLCYSSFFAGQELTALEQETATYSKAVSQIRRENPSIWLAILRQTVLNLLGRSDNPSRLMGPIYYGDRVLSNSAVGIDSADGIHFLLLNKIILLYLLAEYEQSAQTAILMEQHLYSAAGMLVVPLFYFYHSLTLLSLLAKAAAPDRERYLECVNTNQQKLQKRADYAPMNYLHKFHLVEAEKARVLGQVLEAEEFYEQAIAGAAENKFIQEEALAYELAAKFYWERNRPRIARTYMQEAHYAYTRWGAAAKVKDLEIRYPQLFPQLLDKTNPPIRTTASTTSNSSDIALDLATVIKASQAISREIELGQLLTFLMGILIENAGAQTGFLILESEEEWVIEAACELHAEESTCATRVLQSLPMSGRLPESIIQYVIRTREPIILNDATREGDFINDSYIQHHQPRSVLCLPLLNQSKFVGVLYLENQLATGVFTPERSQLLNLLSIQAAIAIENARLYSALCASKSQMAQFLEAVPVGIAVFDAVGRPYYFNQRATQLVGKGSDPSVPLDQLSEAYQVYLAGTKQPYPIERLPSMRALSGERSTVNDIDFHQNGTIIPVEVWSTPVFDEQGNVTYAITSFQDITERKQAERLLADYNQTLERQVTERTMLLSQEIEERQRVENALRHSEEQRRLTLDFTHIGNWDWNIVENTSEWNDNHSRLLGLVPNEVECSYEVWRDRVHPEDVDRVEQAVAKALKTHTDYEAEYRVIHPDGSIHWLFGRGRGIYNEAGQPMRMLGVILDISDRKRAEEASILEERNRMAREIHDTLAQAFTGILLNVGSMTQMLVNESASTQIQLERLERIDELARTGLTEARRSVAALRPQLLEKGNLQSALHRLVTQMQSTTKTTLIYESKGIAYSLPSEVENHLLRIAQESLTNAIKYSNADKIWVELVYEEAHCLLRVKDDGQGFGVGSISSIGGFGLLGMSERAEQIGAQLTIQSQLGQGTEITITTKRE